MRLKTYFGAAQRLISFPFFLLCVCVCVVVGVCWCEGGEFLLSCFSPNAKAMAAKVFVSAQFAEDALLSMMITFYGVRGKQW